MASKHRCRQRRVPSPLRRSVVDSDGAAPVARRPADSVEARRAYGPGRASAGSMLPAAAAAPIASQTASSAPCPQRCEGGVSTSWLRVAAGLGVCAAAAACQFGVVATAALKAVQRPERVEAGSADLEAGMTRR